MKRTKKLSRVLVVIFTILFFFSLAATQIINTYSTNVNAFLGIVEYTSEGGSVGKVYFPTAYANSEAEFQAKSALIREVVSEGTVLLKNENNALPVASGKVAVYFPDITPGYTPEAGGGTFFVVDGQDVNNGEESFIYATNHPGASYKDNSRAFTGEYTTATSTSLTEALAFDGLQIEVVKVPAEGSVPAASDAKVAFVVFGRVAGERADLDYMNEVLQLDARERKTLELAKSSGAEHIVVILSGDHTIEIADIKNDPQVDAIVKVGDVGYRGAYGLADVITGKVSPSGKLVDTYAARVTSAPALQNFGNFRYTNDSEITDREGGAYVANMEGIYVDYKYYETRYEDLVLGRFGADSAVGAKASAEGWSYADEVVYPFGYGLSYSSFEQELVGEPVFNEADHTATVTVKVTNTGAYEGKDVVAVYGQAPYTEYDIENKVEKSAVQLLGFSKTSVLTPGESEEVEVLVHMQWLASFDYTNAKTYIMDAGDYYFALGNGSHDALNNILSAKELTDEQTERMVGAGDSSKVYHWTQGELDTTTYATSVYDGETGITARFQDADINYWYGEGAYTYLSRSDWAGTFPQTLTLTATPEMVSYLNNYNRFRDGTDDTYARAEALAVDGIQVNPEKKVTEPLANVIDMMGKDYDDPSWDAILDCMTAKEISEMLNKGGSVVNGTVSINFPGAQGTDNPIGLNVGNQYVSINNETGEKTPVPSGELLVTDGISDKQVDLNKLTSTMYPSEPTLAATFNVELAYRVGEMMGEDGLYTDQEWNWGLGANLHRSPYCGRLSEYFSADSVNSSLIGAAEAQGAWSKGHVLVAKHFATNDQESNRQGVATFINEQALRENQLRAFEGIFTYGGCKGVMTTYNRIGLIGSTAMEYDMMTELLRNEWNAKCYVITDLCNDHDGLYEGDTMVVAGTDIMLAVGTHAKLSSSAITSDKVLLNAARRAVHNLMYVYVNTAAMNSVGEESTTVYTPAWWRTTLPAVEIGLGALAALSAVWYLAAFNLKKREEIK